MRIIPYVFFNSYDRSKNLDYFLNNLQKRRLTDKNFPVNIDKNNDAINKE